MKKIPIILAAVLMISALASCGNAAESEKISETTEASASVSETEEATSVLTDSLPNDVRFDGESVEFISGTYNPTFSPNFVEEQNGEILNDARFETEQYVEERLGVTINETVPPGNEGNPYAMDSKIKNMVLSGDTTYDIATNMDRFIIANTKEGMFHATSDLPYVDLEALYWNPEDTARFSIGNKIYFTLSAFNLYSYSNTNAIYMNLDVAADFGINGIFDTVREGKWTYELMDKLASDVYVDLNGNGESDESDQYGFVTGNPKSTWINAVVAGGCFDEIMHKDADDYFVYDVSNRFVDVLENIYSFYHKAPYVRPIAAGLGALKMLFNENSLASMSYFRDLEFDFSVLPIPKFDENQESYYCRTYDSHFTMVPITCQQLDVCGAVLEVLSCKAYNTVLPAYINDTLQVKLTRDEESAEMIRLILDTRTISLAEAYMFDIWGDGNTHEKFMLKDNASPVSYIESVMKKTVSEINRYNTYFRKVNGD